MPKLWMGLEGLGRFDDTPDHLPGNWRQKVLQEEPNGDFPLTAMLSKLKQEETDNYKFNWAEKEFPAQGGAVAGVYLNTALTTAYDAQNPVGAQGVVYVKVNAATAGLFVPGAAALLRCGTDFTSDVVGKVTDVVRNGDKSKLAVRLIRADGQGNATLADCDYVMRVGSIFGEAAASPKSISREAEWKHNFTQIFRNSLDITGRMLNTTFRTGKKYQERKGDCLKDHMRDIEWAFLFGEMSDITDEDGQHETTTKGFRACIRDYAPDNILDFTAITEAWAKGKTWTQAGAQFLKNVVLQVTGSGPEDRLLMGGNGTLAGLNALVEAAGSTQYSVSEQTRAYGFKVREYVTPFGTVEFMRHPLFNKVPSLNNAAFVFYPGDLVYRFHRGRDTHFKKDPKNPFNNGVNELSGQVDIDAIHEEFLTDAGLEVHYMNRHAFVSGIGVDNTQR